MGGTLSSYAFNYDPGSRILKIQNADDTFVNYDYANNDELRRADYSPTNRPDEAYTYDANGNRTNTGYVTGVNNQLSSDGKYAYTYDDEGNLKTRTGNGSTRTFTWDYRNRLASVTDTAGLSVSYAYDASNQRIAKTTGGVTNRYVYDRGNVSLEFNGTGATPSVRYFYGTQVDQILAQDKGSGNVSWQLTDQLGSVRTLVGNDGAVRNQFEYDAFGKVASMMTGATDDSRYCYTGREFDGETGLYYYRARYYDANVGRFIGQDPIGFESGDGTNLYAYVSNRPTDRVDPLGLYGRVIAQSRTIQYQDKFGTHSTTNIGQVSRARKQDPNLYIKSDRTDATIVHSSTRKGSDVNRRLKPKIVDIRLNSTLSTPKDQGGHIIGTQLGGSGNDIDNLFPQAGRGYNQNPRSDWRRFEDEVAKNINTILIDPRSLTCPPRTGRLTALMNVNLWYKRPQLGSKETLRPIGLSASVFYLSPFSLFGVPITRPTRIKNP